MSETLGLAAILGVAWGGTLGSESTDAALFTSAASLTFLVAVAIDMYRRRRRRRGQRER